MFRVSRRDMFLLVAATALAIVSLIYASSVWQAIIGVAVVLSAVIALIVGLIDRGPDRSWTAACVPDRLFGRRVGLFARRD